MAEHEGTEAQGPKEQKSMAEVEYKQVKAALEAVRKECRTELGGH